MIDFFRTVGGADSTVVNFAWFVVLISPFVILALIALYAVSKLAASTYRAIAKTVDGGSKGHSTRKRLRLHRVR